MLCMRTGTVFGSCLNESTRYTLPLFLKERVGLDSLLKHTVLVLQLRPHGVIAVSIFFGTGTAVERKVPRFQPPLRYASALLVLVFVLLSILILILILNSTKSSGRPSYEYFADVVYQVRYTLTFKNYTTCTCRCLELHITGVRTEVLYALLSCCFTKLNCSRLLLKFRKNSRICRRQTPDMQQGSSEI